MRFRALIFALTALAASASVPVLAEDKSIVVASTTSTQDSGLFGYILPMFKTKTGIDVKVVAQGFGVKRFDVMYNDFVLIGPKADPAKIKGGSDVVAALKAINETSSPFVSRGDRSGTHSAELALWKAAGLDPTGSKPAWYREIGQGMGAALNTANAMNAYVLSDRGTWISFKNKGDLEILVEGDQRLFNQYGVILVNPAKHPNVKQDLGQAFIDWLVSAAG